MVGWIIFGIYILTVLWAFRFILGYFLYEDSHDYRGRKKALSGEAVTSDIFLTLICCWLGPLVVICRMTYVGWMKFGKDNTDFLSTLFPKPKTIESRAERANRIGREQHDEIMRQRERINDLERESGLSLTRW